MDRLDWWVSGVLLDREKSVVVNDKRLGGCLSESGGRIKVGKKKRKKANNKRKKTEDQREFES